MKAEAHAVFEKDEAPALPAVDVPAATAEDAGGAWSHQFELAPGEQLLRGPIAASFTRVAGDGTTSTPRAGSLYVTSQRLIQVAPDPRSIDLRRITELGLMANHILVTIARSRGLMIEVADAQELRGVVAGAVSARRKGRSKLVPVMASGLGPVADAELGEDVAHVPADRSR
jgi:hypothetical protein